MLGAGLTEIKERTFHWCGSLTGIRIPDNIQYIRKEAFAGSGLESIVIPDSVLAVEEYAFANCNSLKQAVIGKGITQVAEGVFENCPLEEVTIGDRVKKIDEFAFHRTSLESVSIRN